MEKTQKMLMESMRKGVPVYGVTTGFGKSCGKRMPLDIALKNGVNIFRFHGCGTGEPIGIEETRAAMLSRIICLARGIPVYPLLYWSKWLICLKSWNNGR